MLITALFSHYFKCFSTEVGLLGSTPKHPLVVPMCTYNYCILSYETKNGLKIDNIYFLCYIVKSVWLITLLINKSSKADFDFKLIKLNVTKCKFKSLYVGINSEHKYNLSRRQLSTQVETQHHI